MIGKLNVELVPKTCSFSNVRSLLSKSNWDKIRTQCYEEANHICEICGGVGTNQGYKHNVECHEIWEYNEETLTQKLIGLISLCPKCHQVKHFGRTSAIGRQPIAFKHMEVVNDWSHKDCLKHLENVMLTYKKHSKFKWKINLDFLTEHYDISKSVVEKAHNKKRVTKRKFKKKKKK